MNAPPLSAVASRSRRVHGQASSPPSPLFPRTVPAGTIRVVHRIRVRFGKHTPMRFTGHLDLARAWERLLRRAAVPLAYSKGFNPRPRLSLAAALPLGVTSECELVDMWLKGPAAPDDLMATLTAAAPPGLTVHSLKEVPLSSPPLQVDLAAVEYRARVQPRHELAQRVQQLLAAGSLPRERRGKSYDLRPLVETIGLEEDAVVMRLRARPGMTGRPDEVLLALGVDPLAVHIHRTRLIFDSEG